MVQDLSFIGGNVRRYRKQSELTQQQLAEKAGVSVELIGRIERSRITPSLSMLARIADSLALSLVDLVDGGGDRDSGFEATFSHTVSLLKRRASHRDLLLVCDFVESLHRYDDVGDR